MNSKSRSLVALGRSLGMTAVVMAVMALMAFAPAARAQDRFAELGVGGYAQGQPRATGHGTLILGLDSANKTFSYTTAEFRGITDGQPTYSVRTGLARLTANVGNIAVYVLADGGVSNSATATTGSGGFGGALLLDKVAFVKKLHLPNIVSGQLLVDPSTGGKQALVTIGYAFKFNATQ